MTTQEKIEKAENTCEMNINKSLSGILNYQKKMNRAMICIAELENLDYKITFYNGDNSGEAMKMLLYYLYTITKPNLKSRFKGVIMSLVDDAISMGDEDNEGTRRTSKNSN